MEHDVTPPEITEQQAREHEFQKGEPDPVDSDVATIFSESLGEVPTRVIIVEELRELGLISSKKAKKRIRALLDG